MITVENGFAIAEAGDWLTMRDQPVAAFGKTAANRGWKIPGSWFAPDRRVLKRLVSTDSAYFASTVKPFLTRIELLADDPVTVASEKLLLAPTAARQSSRMMKIIPMSFRGAMMVTVFEKGDAVITATTGRTIKVSLKEDETLSVSRASAVAWTGKPPVGSVPRLRVRDLFIPSLPGNFQLTFVGPCNVWFEGVQKNARR